MWSRFVSSRRGGWGGKLDVGRGVGLRWSGVKACGVLFGIYPCKISYSCSGSTGADPNLHPFQVDEPALREGLPLKSSRWAAYLGWAVDAFRLSTAVAAPATQVNEFETAQVVLDIQAHVLCMSPCENKNVHDPLTSMHPCTVCRW